MKTKTQISEMIEKYFGAVENKEKFLNELFPEEDTNVLHYGRIQNEKDIPTDNLLDAHDFTMSFKIFGQHAIITADKKSETISFYYYNNLDLNDLTFRCKSLNEENIFQITSDAVSINTDLSIKKINDLIETEASFNRVLKKFTED